MNREQFSKLESQFGCTVSECSKDTTNQRVLVNSDVKVVNFDKVKEYYRDENNLDSTPSSADSLLLSPEGQEVFVEFKAGGVNEKDLLTKIYDSVIIYSNLMNQSPKCLSDKGTFIVVYDKEREKKANPSTVAKAELGVALLNLAKENYRTFLPLKVKRMTEKFLFNQVIELSNVDFKRLYLDSCPTS